MKSGRHFLQIPGPTNVPDRVLRAIAQPTIDHRGPEFAALGRDVIDGLKRVFKTDADVVIYGHTHRQQVTQLGDQLFVNPGAAGARRFNLSPSVARMTIAGGKAEVSIIDLA